LMIKHALYTLERQSLSIAEVLVVFADCPASYQRRFPY
jgi:hypothetical protein